MTIRRTSILALGIGCAAALMSPRVSVAQEAASTPPWPKPLDARQSLDEYFERQVAEIADRSDVRRYTSLEAWEADRTRLRDELADMLGLKPEPSKSDLQPTIVGTIERDGIVVERLHYQSLPGVYVTANLYRPTDVSEPLPAILYVCGHSAQRGTIDGREISYGNKTGYQRHGAWFARHGYVCLIIDTVQWGEFLGSHWGTYREGQWHWLTRGYTPAGIETWNGIRGLDYLESRPEVDAERIGLTGRSGGGAYTWFIAALDDRPRAIVPVAGITDLENHVVDDCVSGHCDCMYMVNYHRWDYPQLAALVAPRPMLLQNSDRDEIFPLDGVLRTADQVRHVYELYDAEEDFGLMITPGPHQDTPELRVGAFRWMDRYLKGLDQPIDEPALERFTREELRVFESLPSDERVRTVQDVLVAANQHADQPASEANGDRVREQLVAQALRGWPQEAPDPRAEKVWSASGEGTEWELWEYQSQPSVRLRALVARPTTEASEKVWIVRVTDDQGWRQAEQRARAGKATETPDQPVAYLAPRGVGPHAWEASPVEQTHIRRRYYLIGQTLEGMQIWDVLRGLDFLARHPLGKGGTVRLEADASVQGIAAFAAALAENAAVEIEDAPPLPDDYARSTPLLGAGRVPGLEDWVRQQVERSESK